MEIISVLEEKVYVLEQELLELKKTKSSEDSVKSVSKCIECDKLFCSKKNLKMHVLEAHRKKIKCRVMFAEWITVRPKF